MINVGLSDKDAAFENLRRAINERSPKLIWLNADHIYDDLHSDPRFIDILHRIGFQQ